MPTFTVLVLLLVTDFVRAEYSPVPRWGQATARIDNFLFVQGGRIDQYNSYSYSSAPVNNDLLLLSLSSSFNISSPPWLYIPGCTDCAISPSPAVVWHTLTPYNTSSLLIIGGDTGPESTVTQNNATVILNAYNRADPTWVYETGGPVRRMYHSAASQGGMVWIIGGEKVDGSGEAYDTHYVFDPAGPTFTELSTTNAPPAIYGHATVLLADGTLLVLGGYAPTIGLVSFATIWALNTTSQSWSTLSISNTTLPTSRRGFVAVMLPDGKVLIQGGADAVMQTVYADGWTLDTTQSPMVWSAVDELSQVGARRDHFGVIVGSVVIFGFGYGSDGPVNTTLQIYDSSARAFLSSYDPPAAVISPTTTTLPGPVQTGAGSGSSASGTYSPGSSPTGSEHGSGTSTGTDGTSSPIQTGSGHNGSGGDDGDGSSGPIGTPVSSTTSKQPVTAIAVGTAFGVLALVACTAAAWYLRRRNSRNSFHRLDVTDDSENPNAPILTVSGITREKTLLPPVVRTVREHLTGVAAARSPRNERRDMLADEDTRQFGWSGWHARRTSGSDASWISLGESEGHNSARPTLGQTLQGSLASLRSVGGTLLAAAVGAGPHSREGSTGSRVSARRNRAKDDLDPCTDDTHLLHGAFASRPRGGRRGSSMGYSYADPFGEYEAEPKLLDEDEGEYTIPSLLDPPPKPILRAALHPSAVTVDSTRLTSVLEQPSRTTLTDPTASSNNSDTSHSAPFSTMGTPGTLGTSQSSLDNLRSSGRRTSSLIDAGPPATLIRRSDSWWARFAKMPLLDRRASTSTAASRTLDFRDPQPPPRLGMIEERGGSAGEGVSREGSGGSAQVYRTGLHGRSASSLRTADSEAIERLARTVEVVRKSSTLGSRRSEDSGRTREGSGGGGGGGGGADVDVGLLGEVVQSPVERADAVPVVPLLPPPLQKTVSAGQVAARVQAYERRMSQTETPPPAPRRGRMGVYGLAPKPSLFVANPDSRQGSGDS